MIKIKSAVTKNRAAKSTIYQVSTTAFDDATTPPRYIMGASDLAQSFAEAFEVAAEQREAIDGMLMDSVYRERLDRRDQHTIEPTA